MKNFKTLMNGKSSAEIRCLYSGRIVRKLKVIGSFVEVDAITEAISVPLDTDIVFEPWVFDRGNMLFDLCGKTLKLCTEGDLIEFPNGERDAIR